MVVFRKSLRDLWLLKWQSLSIILVVVCGVSLLAGFDMGLRSLFFTRDKISSDLNAADLEVLFIPKDIEAIPDFADLEGLEKVERRLIFPGTILLNDGKKLSGLYILLESPNPEINSLGVIEGSTFDSENIFAATIERGLARHHGFKPGDVLKIKVGEKIYHNQISGTVMSPEFLIGTSNPDFYAPGKGTLGVVFGNLKRNKKALGFTLVNSLLFSYSQVADAVRLKERILERLKGFTIEKVIPGNDRFTYKFMQLELDIIAVVVIAAIIGVVAFWALRRRK